MDTHNYQLTITRGPEPGKVIPLTSGSMTIGRDPMSEITINDPEVSRRHASLTATLSGYQIQDLGSTNGTFVDGVRLAGDALVLQSGHVITIGGGVALIYQAVTDVDSQAATILDDLDLPVVGEETEIVEASAEEPASPGYPLEASAEDSADEVVPPAEAFEVAEEQRALASDLESVAEDYAEAEQEQDQELLSPEADVRETPFQEVPYEETEPATSYEATDFSQPVVIPHEGKEEIAGEERPPFYRRMSTIIAAILLLILCCCCAFLLFFYYVGGDWLLRQMGLP